MAETNVSMGFYPIGVECVGDNAFELWDHTQSYNMILSNGTAVEFRVKIFVDGVLKNTYILAASNADEVSRGGNGSSHIMEPLFVCIPEMKNLGVQPMVVFYDDPKQWKTIRGEFTPPTGVKLVMGMRVRFAEVSRPIFGE